MRDIQTLIGTLKCIVPECMESLHAELASISSSVDYAPPELMRLQWERLSDAFLPYCDPPKEDWQITVCAVMSDVNVSVIHQRIADYQAEQA